MDHPRTAPCRRLRRRDLLAGALGAGGWMLLERAADAAAGEPTTPSPAPEAPDRSDPVASRTAGPLSPPPGRIPVAFLISDGATVIDFCGPWEVFQDVHVESRGSSGGARRPFELFTVADSTEPVRASGGLHLIPDFDFDDAPRPKVVVVPALRSSSRMIEWLRALDDETDAILSVCTGAFVLARAGLLDGRRATTHHLFLDRLAAEFLEVEVVGDRRWVEGERVSTAGGLTSGIDLALRTVERYFGPEVARATIDYLEYQSPVWGRGSPGPDAAIE